MLYKMDTVAHSPAAPWHGAVLAQLGTRLAAGSGFPCTFSQNAYKRGLIDFAFVPSLDADALDAASAAITEYVTHARQWSGKVNDARALVMAFDIAETSKTDVNANAALGWRILSELHMRDPEPWPDDVARTTTDPYWSFCHSGMQLFVNMSHPAHIHRRSRNLGDRLLFIINPRERFDIVAPDTDAGWKQRNTIRARSGSYDGQPHAPQLGSYQKGELEWVQYALPDTNDAIEIACPFQIPKPIVP